MQESKLSVLINKIEANTDSNSAYQLSILLLLYAFQGMKKEYVETFDKMLNALIKEKDELKPWLLGRMLTSASVMLTRHNFGKTKEEHPVYDFTSQKIVETLNSLVKQNGINIFSAWALGYLVSFYAQNNDTSYAQEDDIKNAKTQLIELHSMVQNLHSNDKLETSDKLWVAIMYLYAAAHCKDISNDNIDHFALAKSQIIEIADIWPGTENQLKIKLAFEKVPYKDFQLWAKEIGRYAALLVGDEEMYDALEVSEADFQKSMEETKGASIADQALAIVYKEFTEELAQQAANTLRFC